MNQIRTGAILNYVIIGLNILVGLGYTPYMLKCLGQSEYGLYSLVSSVIAYLTILDFGFGNAIVRYTAKFRAENKFEEQWRMFGMFIIVYSAIGLIAFAGGLALYSNVDVLFERTMSAAELSQARVMMLLLTVNLAVTFPFSVYGSIITAYENFVFQRVVNILRILLATAVMIAVLAIGYKAIALVVVQTVFNILTLIINCLYCRYRLRIQIHFTKIKWSFLKEISVYSFWIFLNVIMDKVYWGTGQFVLGALSGTVAVAIFSVAILLQQMYFQFSTSISSVLLPKITAMVALKKSPREISDLFIRTGRLQCIIMALILSAFIVFGRTFIRLWAGDGYELSFVITLIFFSTLFIPMIQNTGIAIIQARNQMRFRSLAYLFTSLASLVCQVLLARPFGVIGCAAAIGGALIIGQGLIMNIYYYKVQKIDIPKFWHEIFRLIRFPILLTIAGLILHNYIDGDNILLFICYAGIFTAVYAATLWFTSLNSYEKSLVIDVIGKFKRSRQ